MELVVERWTTGGALVYSVKRESDSSGISFRKTKTKVHGNDRRKSDDSTGPDYTMFETDEGAMVALKSGHAYRLSAGDAVIETHVLEGHEVLPLPGPIDASLVERVEPVEVVPVDAGEYVEGVDPVSIDKDALPGVLVDSDDAGAEPEPEQPSA